MPRGANVELPTQEEIISYEYYRSGSVRVTVALGTIDESGNFIVDTSYSQQSYDLVGDDFDELMAAKGDKPQGRFRLEDLWDSVDKRRLDIKDQQDKKLKENQLDQEVRNQNI